MPVNAGVGRAIITPPVGIKLSGYASRKTGATGIHDDLTATVLYLEQDGLQAALVGLEVIQMDAAEIAAVRACCQELTGVPAEHVMIACTHTHSGPLTGPGEDEPVRAAYAANLRWQIAGALREARQAPAPVSWSWGTHPVRLAGNRRERTPQGVILGYNPDGPTPTAADVLSFTLGDSETPALVTVVYDCHGTTLGPDNLLISADYGGHARRLAESQLPGSRAMVLGGCGADQNPYPRGTHALAETHGRRLGAAAYQAVLEMGEKRPAARLGVACVAASLPVDEPPDLETCRQQLQEAEAAVEAQKQAHGEDGVDWFTSRQLRHARERLELVESGASDVTLICEVQALVLDDVGFVALPGEIFIEIGRAIRERSGLAVTLPLGWANGSIGYVPTSAEVPFGGYEIEMARANRCGLPIRPEADEALAAAAVEALALASR